MCYVLVNSAVRSVPVLTTQYLVNFNRYAIPHSVICHTGYIPRKHKTFVYHLYNVGPTTSTLVQHCINGIQMFCVCWPCLCHTATDWQITVCSNTISTPIEGRVAYAPLTWGRTTIILLIVQPRKHEAVTQCCFNAGPASKTVGQQWNSIG